jgi:hypothetical protein
MMMTTARRVTVSVTTSALAVLVVCTLVVGVEAQTVPVRLIGAVQWIGGQKMALALDDGASVHVDLVSVEQEAYQRLTSGDRIVVTGALSPRRDRVIATAIIPAQ